MKTIAFDLSFISTSNLVGSAKFIQRLIREMMKMNLDFKYIFYIQKHIDPEILGINIQDPNVTIVRLPSLKSRFKRILFQQTLFYFYQKKADVIYSFCTYLPLFAKGKKIITLHDMLPFIFTKKHSKFRRAFIVNFTKLIASKANHIVTVSDNSKKDIIKYLDKKESEITLISNFICDDEEVIQCNSSTDGLIESREGKIQLIKPYICTVSSLQPGKNLLSLIRAFNIFHKEYPQYHLYLCGGKGWGYQELFDEVKKLKASEYIHFTGYVPDKELDKIYTDATAVAYVSYFEGFGIPPLEGFHHGKPCVASNTTSLPEVVEDAGVLVDPYDVDNIAAGIKELVERKDSFQGQIKKQINKFSAKKETAKFINLLNRL